MPSRTSAQRRGTVGRPLKSPLAVAGSARPEPDSIPGVGLVRADATDRQRYSAVSG